MNYIRNILAESLAVDGAPESVVAMAGGRHDFGTLLPTRERKEWEFALRNEYFEYYNDERDEWDAESVYTAEEAHGKANSYQRYRLFTFSNFLTKPKTISTFQVNVEDILGDARPGSVLLIIGGKGGDYPAIYERMARLAEAAGIGFSPYAVCLRSRVAKNTLGLKKKNFYK